jgi:hypothetical protein
LTFTPDYNTMAANGILNARSTEFLRGAQRADSHRFNDLSGYRPSVESSRGSVRKHEVPAAENVILSCYETP